MDSQMNAVGDAGFEFFSVHDQVPWSRCISSRCAELWSQHAAVLDSQSVLQLARKIVATIYFAQLKLISK